MKLAFAGAPEVRATAADVWRRLLDPHFIGASTPGVESVEVTGPNAFRMELGFGVALLKFRFDMDVSFHDVVEGESARMEARGTASGTTVAMISRIRIEELSRRLQRLHWEAETTITGTLAGIGGKLVEGVAHRLTGRFWEDFAERVEREAAA
ncbi:MAG TPA: SRPBCC domain-containing protein [Gemmatimonadales bacterium]